MPERKLLCLHGIGTSAAIMRHQMQSLSRALQDKAGIECIFVDAANESPGYPGIEIISPGPYYSWFSWTVPPRAEDVHSVEKAYKTIYDAIAEDGPFEGILGFSQGASLAYAFCIQHAEKYPWDSPFVHFNYAVLIAGQPAENFNDELSSALIPAGPLHIPSLHIYGKLDDVYTSSVRLMEACDPDQTTVIDHAGDHNVPKDPALVAKIVASVQRMADEV